MRVLHVISGLGLGGAERFLCRLSRQLAAQYEVEQLVVSIDSRGDSDIGYMFERCEVVYLNAGSLSGLLSAPTKLAAVIDAFAPDIVQSWLYRADLVASLAKWRQQKMPLLWNIRCADAILPLTTRLLIKGCALLSRWAPNRIIVCGHRALNVHRRLGYDASRMTVINNGYQFDDFPLLQEKMSVGPTSAERPFVIGAAGRFDPSKDYKNLLNAFAILRKQGRRVKLVIAGKGCSYKNNEIASLIDELKLRDFVELHGEVLDMAEFYGSLDAFCLSSVSEGFPNVVCEAMGYAVLPVVTDAGDAADIVGEAGIVVPVSDSVRLAAALVEVIDLPEAERSRRRHMAASQVRLRFDIDQIAQTYFETYTEVLEQQRST
ncbi:MAG: glycosyltransferase [Sphingorhabdus sp.]